jgi:hypothetical protein
MAEEVKLQKTVYDPIKFIKVVDTSFKTFAKPIPVEDTDTVEELFRLYNKLYLRIPIEGDTNSHQYLVTESSKLYSQQVQSVDVQPLLDEITQLRQQLLSANQEILALSVQQSK